MIAEAPEFFTGGFDEQEQAVTIMKSEVFFPRFGFKDFVVSQWACNARHVWIPSIIGTRF
ncbi:hypothetical protein BN133_2175 [Cronobacter dublinensis 582]|nr:hypothetical protein BN133_2175 [Cronobacter dublinensis 582]